MCDAPKPVAGAPPQDAKKLDECRWLFEAAEELAQWIFDSDALREAMRKHRHVRRVRALLSCVCVCVRACVRVCVRACV